MSIQISFLFCICIAVAVPLVALATSNHQVEEGMVDNFNGIDRFEETRHRGQQPHHSLSQDDGSSENEHFLLKKAADFEQILKPCNKIPASGRGQEYADCVRNRMLLMGRRKRRQAV
ncbi:unnamed protein product [Adineta ricciae]|uniref:Uncharacterized protein n=1 Tax=Adineta ricciae TaxID=249248 RepID=A0A813MNG2_ADIRI|nr:unnamed protein product [Adineta ricciae]CAF0774292.1 unnamed protein product [Adineta ricciae]